MESTSINEMMQKLVQDQQLKMENLIKAALNKHGFQTEGSAALDLIRDRGNVVDFQGTKTLYIDKKPICAFKEPEFAMNGNKFTVTYHFKEL